MHRLRSLWIALKSSLWFVPTCCVVTMITLAIALIELDVALGSTWIKGFKLLFGIGSDGARGMLAAIAGSMMTVASLTFSLTISTLATASAQYTSGLIRNFMRDRLNQFVLGFFVGLFAYCLVVLRTIRGGDEGQFVPSIAVFAGLLLALASIGLLIAFIHHIADSIEAGTILGRVADETCDSIEALFPAGLGEPAEREHAGLPDAAHLVWHPVKAGRAGYVQTIDGKELIAIAERHDGIVRMEADVGDFVSPRGPVCSIAMPEPPDESTLEHLREAYSIGAARSIEQDPNFGVRQLVDMAQKSLAGGANDTGTAIMCVEHLGAVIESLAARSVPDHLRAADGVVRVVASGRTFEGMAGLAFDEVRISAAGKPSVLLALFRAIATAAAVTDDAGRRATLLRHASLIAAQVDHTVREPADRAALRGQLGAALQSLGSEAAVDGLIPATRSDA